MEGKGRRRPRDLGNSGHSIVTQHNMALHSIQNQNRSSLFLKHVHSPPHPLSLSLPISVLSSKTLRRLPQTLQRKLRRIRRALMTHHMLPTHINFTSHCPSSPARLDRKLTSWTFAPDSFFSGFSFGALGAEWWCEPLLLLWWCSDEGEEAWW